MKFLANNENNFRNEIKTLLLFKVRPSKWLHLNSIGLTFRGVLVCLTTI